MLTGNFTEVWLEFAGKTIVDRSPGAPICVPLLRAMGWRRPRLRAMTFKG